MNGMVLVSKRALRIILRTLVRRGGGILLRDPEEAAAADELFEAAYGPTMIAPAGPVTVEPAGEPAFEQPAVATAVRRGSAVKAKRGK